MRKTRGIVDSLVLDLVTPFKVCHCGVADASGHLAHGSKASEPTRKQVCERQLLTKTCLSRFPRLGNWNS
jgi:hypothetical protein